MELDPPGLFFKTDPLKTDVAVKSGILTQAILEDLATVIVYFTFCFPLLTM